MALVSLVAMPVGWRVRGSAAAPVERVGGTEAIAAAVEGPEVLVALAVVMARDGLKTPHRRRYGSLQTSNSRSYHWDVWLFVGAVHSQWRQHPGQH